MSSFAVRIASGALAVLAALPGCAKQEALFPTKQEVPSLIAKLQDPSPKVRQDAADRIRYLKADAIDALPQLLKMWEDEDLTCRTWASEAVGAIGEAAYPDIKQRLTHEDGQIRDLAWRALQCLPMEVKREHVQDINPLFAKGILDEDDRVRRRASFAFMNYNSVAKDASASVIEALKTYREKWAKDLDKWVIFYIIAAFQYYEEEHLELARPLVPVLKELMKSPDEQIRGCSTGLLRQLGEITIDDSKADPSKTPRGPRGPPPKRPSGG